MRKGERMSEELKMKVSQGRKGKCLGHTHGFKKGFSYRKGIPNSEESKKKMSLAKIGKPSPRKGAKLSYETRRKISISKRKFFLRQNPDYKYYAKDILSDNRKQIRRERIKKYGGFHSKGEWETLKTRYNWTCPSCKKSEPRIKLTRDHIIPISRGGSDNIENIQPLCTLCNTKKSVQTIRY